MIRINLLPYREQRWRLQLLKLVSITVSVLVVVILVMTTVHLITSGRLEGLRAEKATLQKENARLKRKIGKIRNIDKLRKDVEAKLAVIDTLQAGRFRSLRSLLALSKSLPESVWLTSIRDNGKGFLVVGKGESNNVVAEFMRQLDASPNFANVRLDVIKRGEVNGVKVRAFTLSMDLVDLNNEPKKRRRRR